MLKASLGKGNLAELEPVLGGSSGTVFQRDIFNNLGMVIQGVSQEKHALATLLHMAKIPWS